MERPVQNKELIGASPLDVFTYIVCENPQITSVGLQQYVYMPREQSDQETVWLTRDEFLHGQKVREIIEGLPEDVQMVVFSKVLLQDGKSVHIQMMDFNLQKNEQGLNLVVERLKKVGVCSGWVLESGDSYHFYGSQLLSENEWVNFMGDCLLTSVVHGKDNIEQVADPRYIGHSLKRGGNALRITTRAGKTFEPRVVAFLK